VNRIHHLPAAAEPLQLLADHIQNQTIMLVRRELHMSPTCTDELMHPGFVMGVITNITGVQAKWDIGN